MKKYNMLTDKPGRSLFFFALPMILGNLFQQFYTTVAVSYTHLTLPTIYSV